MREQRDDFGGEIAVVPFLGMILILILSCCVMCKEDRVIYVNEAGEVISVQTE